MNTETGRIYSPEVMEEAEEALRRQLARERDFTLHGNAFETADGERIDPREVTPVEVKKRPQRYADAVERLTHDEEVAEALRALRAGQAVPVSGEVVQQARLGQREKRRRRRRAQRSARKANRR